MACMTLRMEIEYRYAWWLDAYLWLLAFFCELMNRDPDGEKLLRLVLWSCRWRVNGGRWRSF